MFTRDMSLPSQKLSYCLLRNYPILGTCVGTTSDFIFTTDDMDRRTTQVVVIADGHYIE